MDPQNPPYQQDHEHPQHPYALPYAQHLHEHSQQQPHDPATYQLHHPHMTRVPAGLPQANRTDFLHSFWTEQMTIAERFESDFKVHPLPLARIKKVMKSDIDVKQMISAEAPMLFSKACEIFITELTSRAWMHAEENKRRTLQRSDVASAVGKSDQFDFLIDIVPREEQGKAKRHKEDEIAYDHASYYYSPTGQPYATHGDPSAYYHQMQQVQQYHQYAQQQGGVGYPGYPPGALQSGQTQYHQQSPNMTGSRPPHQYEGDRASQYDGDRTSQYEGERASQYEGQRASQYKGESTSQYEGERASQYEEERSSQYEEDKTQQYDEERPPQS